VADVDLATTLLISVLDDDDSFVYLSVVHALKDLLDIDAKTVFSKLFNLFENSTAWEVEFSVSLCKRLSRKAQNITRSRTLLGEALIFGVRKSGKGAIIYADILVPICIRVCRGDADRKAFQTIIDSSYSWRAEKVNILSVDSPQPNLLSSSDITSDEENILIALAADAALLRQSAVSLLAEFISIVGFGSSKYLYDTLQLAADVVKVEHTSSTVAVTMRR
jgi:hypothetical protein